MCASKTKEEYQNILRGGWLENEDYVFISYASRNWEQVYPTVLDLRARGINVYIDTEFLENQSDGWLKNFRDPLIKGRCKGIVAFLSIDYMRSYACLMEQLANCTKQMKKRKKNSLPVFYIALEPNLETLQAMSDFIYTDKVMAQSMGRPVKMSPQEHALLRDLIRDGQHPGYETAEAVEAMIRDINDAHDVVTTMYELIFENSNISIISFGTPEKCAHHLESNFTNHTNRSIQLTPNDDLSRATRSRIQGSPAPGKPEAAAKSGDGRREEQTLSARAAAGNAGAQNSLGLCLLSGDGMAQDPAQAAAWFRRAAEQGLAEAQSNLGRCYFNGLGVEQSWTQAVYWFQQAAKQGLAEAQNHLGRCYANGQGVQQSWAQAADWYRRAAEQGHTAAQNSLGCCYADGHGVEKSLKQAVYWFRQAAEQGLDKAQNNLGISYANGLGVEQSWAQAVSWYQKAAKQGLAEAKNSLGRCYFNGQGVEQSWTQAVYWFQQAAEQGLAMAQSNLGVCYANGRGVKQSWEQAAAWYRKAAEQGYKFAQGALADCYAGGLGVPRDPVQAKYWRSQADQNK